MLHCTDRPAAAVGGVACAHTWLVGYIAVVQVYLAVKADPWVLTWAPTSQHSSAMDVAVEQWGKSNTTRSNEVRRSHCPCEVPL